MATKLAPTKRKRLHRNDWYLTQQEAAHALGISRARVAQIEDAALRKIGEHPIMRQLAIDLKILEEGERHHERA
jgi:DNA-directed RNA polymerase sigma subunit (sigma70/sigma32)